MVGEGKPRIISACSAADTRPAADVVDPDDGTAAADLGDPARCTSQWPGNVGYGAGLRPRSATAVITKNNGRRVGT
jgi:hypothetical protein